LAVGHCTYRVEARSDQKIHHSTYLKLDSEDNGFADVLSLTFRYSFGQMRRVGGLLGPHFPLILEVSIVCVGDEQ